jgi:hypothetical protein
MKNEILTKPIPKKLKTLILLDDENNKKKRKWVEVILSPKIVE